ncbi:hypothetical protein EJ08DRAFT_700436 [Tothia fuscella]|uniref:Uncharacterized protein n=1 Tax=Tothia fuscella TaxID=1048955 RepID=A0A9P4TVX8_9PEZI|nr:hypothetical protein EJ08DRAFT_700436 [Tothia fuscella]
MPPKRQTTRDSLARLFDEDGKLRGAHESDFTRPPTSNMKTLRVVQAPVTVQGPPPYTGPLTGHPEFGAFFRATAHLPRETPETFRKRMEGLGLVGTVIGFGDCPLPANATANTTAQNSIDIAPSEPKDG